MVEHTKIGEVSGNLQKEMMGEMSDGGRLLASRINGQNISKDGLYI